MDVARRIAQLPPYLFVEINNKIAEKKALGEEIISFAIGDPDMPTPEHVIKKLKETAEEPANHRYPESEGLPELRQAIARWYQKRFGVELDPETEVLPLIGSKEGIFNIAMCYINPGDYALVPDPYYPVYPVSVAIAGGMPYYMPLRPENGYLPKLSVIPADIVEKAKMLWLNYPNNPTGAVAEIGFYESVAEFAQNNDILVCNDAPYTELAYDNYRPVSMLQAKGAMKTGIEFHSLSKTYNMTGWRIGMAVGNAEVIKYLRTLKSNIDSGIPQAIQYMAIEALDGPQDSTNKLNAIYQKRRDLVIEVLNSIGIETLMPKAGLYIWAKVPDGFNSVEFVADLLDKVGVAVTPGTGYGKNGEGYVRLSLTISDVQLVKGLSRMSSWRNTRRLTSKRA
ncbi:LL-diaminopimelate aminotransferase [Chloroflexota bacterium]